MVAIAAATYRAASNGAASLGSLPVSVAGHGRHCGFLGIRQHAVAAVADIEIASVACKQDIEASKKSTVKHDFVVFGWYTLHCVTACNTVLTVKTYEHKTSFT